MLKVIDIYLILATLVCVLTLFHTYIMILQAEVFPTIHGTDHIYR